MPNNLPIMRITVFFLTVFASLSFCTGYSQADRCQSEELQATLMEDSAFSRSYFAFEAAMADMQPNTQRSSLTHTLPVVVHIMHDGAPIGDGSNLSDAQVFSAIDGLNDDFSAQFAGVDIDIEFQLAVQDPDGNPTSGIVRTNVAETIPSYATSGMVTMNNLDPAAELLVKQLSHWPGEDYINIWVVHKLNGAASPLGFAYLPPTSGVHDGIVVHRRVFGVGEDFDLMQNFDLNRTITHEMGHYLGLFHTFNNTSSCADESNCSAQGDRVCDTPPTTGSVGCSPVSCPNTLVENYMDYSSDACMDSFTEGQRTRMRNALDVFRTSLLTSSGNIPVMAIDGGISSLTGIQEYGCASTINTQALLQNFGTDELTSASIHFMLDDGMEQELTWSGSLLSGETELVDLPSLAATTGAHTISIWSGIDGDGYGPNDTLVVSFEISSGEFIEMEVQLDMLPYGFTWEIENVDNGNILMSGGPYDNSTDAGSLFLESQCAVTGCYELTVEDIFGNGLHYTPSGFYSLTDSDGNVLGYNWGNFGGYQLHEFCIDGDGVEPCVDDNGNGICDEDEDIVITDVPGCTDAGSCTYDAEANTDDGSCQYLDALGDCGGDCPDDLDADGVCDNAEIPGCTDENACNFDGAATDDAGNCSYPPTNYDCDGNVTVVIEGCLDEASCTYDASANANTDDGSCAYLDALGDCGGDCPDDVDGDGVCDNAEIPGCTDFTACNFEAGATDDNGGCLYPEPDLDCNGNPLVVIEGCMDPASCTYDAAANTNDDSCEYLDAIGVCGGDCPGDADTDGVCDNAEIAGCTDSQACNYDASATDDAGNCSYPPTNFDCDGNITVVVNGCLDASSCTFDADANTDDGSCEYLDALGECGGDCPDDVDGDGVCDNAEIPGCTDVSACNYDATATDENGGCEYPETGLDCAGNPLVIVEGCTDASSCTFDAAANTDDGSCEYLDALGECGGDCPADVDGDGVCDNAEIPGCTDVSACNYDAAATDENGACEYPEVGFDCDGNPLVIVEGCTDPGSCTFDADANSDDGSCEYLDALGECGGDCTADLDEDGVCDDAEILGCTDTEACNFDEAATEENGGCEYAAEGFDCDGNPLTSGVGEISDAAESISAYPNPVLQGAPVQLAGLTGTGPWTIEIWNAAGQCVARNQAVAAPSLNGWIATVNTPAMPGLYFIRAQRLGDNSVPTAAGRLLVH